MELAQIIKNLKDDVPAGIIVFLVALPLCLGIALASGAPLVSGIVAGIVGGVVVGSLSGSQLSVSGPAAGLTVIVLNAIDNLGSFEAFLCAVIVAGLFQIFMGVSRVGVIALYFPSSVIKGMLAAIGLILIMKQVPHLIGVDSDAFGEMNFIQSDGTNTLSFLFKSFQQVVPGSFAIGLCSLLAMITWESPMIKRSGLSRALPAGLLAVGIGLLMSFGIDVYFPQYSLGKEHLVNLPDLALGGSMLSQLPKPDFNAVFNPQFFTVAFTLAIVASIETLLCIEAVDKLDPEKRRTDKNRELMAQGVGNVFCGFLGGLPLTSVIVRSSANIEANARSKMSAILHGIFLLLAIGVFANYFNRIPLASLAAILIVIGYKLSKPALYINQYRKGNNSFVPFMVTIVAILFTDLLVGIIVGMMVGFYYIIHTHHKVSTFHVEKVANEQGGVNTHIQLSEQVSFLSKAELISALDTILENSTVIVDGRNAKAIDPDVLELLSDFKESAEDKNIEVIYESISL